MTPAGRAKAMLPYVPDEVFNMFLAPLIETDGWPSDTSMPLEQPWSLWLGTHFLNEFINLRWKRDTLLINENVLHPNSQGDINALISAVFYNSWTPAGYDLAKAKMRVHSQIEIIRRTGHLCAPIVITHTPAGFRVLDGHHRMAAHYTLRLHTTIPVPAWIGK